MNFIEIGFRVSDPFVNVLTLESIFNFIEIYKLFVLLKNIELDLWKVFVIKLRQRMQNRKTDAVCWTRDIEQNGQS